MGIAPLVKETASTNSSTGSRLSFASPLFSELHRWMAFELLRPDLDDAALLPSSSSSSTLSSLSSSPSSHRSSHHRSQMQMLPSCDIWSYGSTVLEVSSKKIIPLTPHNQISLTQSIIAARQVMTGNIPYHYHSDTTQVLDDIKQGIKPRIDTVSRVLSPPLINFIQSCWTEDPESRPSATAVTQTMTRIYEQS